MLSKSRAVAAATAWAGDDAAKARPERALAQFNQQRVTRAPERSARNAEALESLKEHFTIVREP